VFGSVLLSSAQQRQSLEGAGGARACVHRGDRRRYPLLTWVSDERDVDWYASAGMPYVVLAVDADTVGAWKRALTAVNRARARAAPVAVIDAAFAV